MEDFKLNGNYVIYNDTRENILQEFCSEQNMFFQGDELYICNLLERRSKDILNLVGYKKIHLQGFNINKLVIILDEGVTKLSFSNCNIFDFSCCKNINCKNKPTLSITSGFKEIKNIQSIENVNLLIKGL